MTKAKRTPIRWARWALAVFLVLLGCLAWGVTTASAHLSLGPHQAEYAVSTDGQVTVDVGPLGTLRIDSPLPLHLGVDVIVGEIPDDLTAIGQAQTLEALSGDLNSYLQFFAGPDQTIHAVTSALVTDALWRAAVAFAMVATIVAGIVVLLGTARRAELAQWIARHMWGLASAVVIVVLVAAGLTASVRTEPVEAAEEASPVFANTPLEGARITGRLAGVIDTYGAQLIGLYDDNVDFYEKADANLVRAWNARDTEDALFALSGPGRATDLASGPSAAATPEEPDAAVDDPAAPTDSPEPVPSRSVDESELVTLMVISDLHCNIGMTPLISTAIRRSGADVVLNAGDTTMNGTSVESFCVSSFSSAVPRGVSLVVADGNHDSAETSAQERKEGAEVLDGSVIKVKGIRILGDRDALETRVGQGSSAAQEETPAAQAERLAATACDADDGVDLLLVHSPRAGNESLASGCVPLQVSGHTHAMWGPAALGNGVRYVNGSTAGAATGQPTVGPLHGTAEMTVLRFDPVARQFVDWQLVRVRPDTSAVVGPRLAFPEADPVAPDPIDDSEPTESPSSTSEIPGGDSPGEGSEPAATSAP